MSDSPSPLALNAISKSFHGTPVLRDISLSLVPGEVIGLVGINGAGKTTMINIILNLLSQDSGDVQCFGQSTAHVSARRSLAFLPEKFHPSAYLKGYEFLSLSLSFFKKSLDKQKADDIATALGLNPSVLSSRVGKYSKGMGQKLGLASVFLSETPLLILDEPMSGLDPLARIQLKEQIHTYKSAGNTVFFSSHILTDVEEMCDRIAILHNGELLFLGKPSAFTARYQQDNAEQAFLQAIA